jgi:hypothetical protein
MRVPGDVSVVADVYRVTWKLGDKALGPTLRFQLPLAR